MLRLRLDYKSLYFSFCSDFRFICVADSKMLKFYSLANETAPPLPANHQESAPAQDPPGPTPEAEDESTQEATAKETEKTAEHASTRLAGAEEQEQEVTTQLSTPSEEEVNNHGQKELPSLSEQTGPGPKQAQLPASEETSSVSASANGADEGEQTALQDIGENHAVIGDEAAVSGPTEATREEGTTEAERPTDDTPARPEQAATQESTTPQLVPPPPIMQATPAITVPGIPAEFFERLMGMSNAERANLASLFQVFAPPPGNQKQILSLKVEIRGQTQLIIWNV